ncbi:hypothetical protein ACFW9S_16055 [Streptomyces anulatus]|uniref:hypothetical protein n=1 Tax=Streptomyces anulatus TaxID=1892 RepID=UPI003690B4C5
MDLVGAGDEVAAYWRRDPQEAADLVQELTAGGELAADEVLDAAVDTVVVTGLLALAEARTAATTDPSTAAELCLPPYPTSRSPSPSPAPTSTEGTAPHHEPTPSAGRPRLPARTRTITPSPARLPLPHRLLWHRASDPGDDARVINREISSRLAAGHGRRVTQLADAAARWGGHVPEDPGITELADLLETAATNAPDRPGDSGHTTRALLAGAVEDLRAAARLGGLLPAVTLWHLQRAIDQEHTAHQHTVPAQRQEHRR